MMEKDPTETARQKVWRMKKIELENEIITFCGRKMWVLRQTQIFLFEKS